MGRFEDSIMKLDQLKNDENGNSLFSLVLSPQEMRILKDFAEGKSVKDFLSEVIRDLLNENAPE